MLWHPLLYVTNKNDNVIAAILTNNYIHESLSVLLFGRYGYCAATSGCLRWWLQIVCLRWLPVLLVSPVSSGLVGSGYVCVVGSVVLIGFAILSSSMWRAASQKQMKLIFEKIFATTLKKLRLLGRGIGKTDRFFIWFFILFSFFAVTLLQRDYNFKCHTI